eukprot:305252-Pleurochrysis_carterae.AAC.1
MDPTGGYRCKDAVAHDVNSPAEALKVYGDGCKQRATASTKMNAGEMCLAQRDRCRAVRRRTPSRTAGFK